MFLCGGFLCRMNRGHGFSRRDSAIRSLILEMPRTERLA
ncbi:hypothetical protein AOX55_00006079 (plasmid) [Sinorhizobium fredii CCBAU 25509]|nr:hypothetical protein SF83666_b60700 [Sinorhizobium fredii CCBAU 83666]AWM28854.1 hypothetical protein AOX55_00006079 [Sinorhizobium fredii CCBAU 25509]